METIEIMWDDLTDKAKEEIAVILNTTVKHLSEDTNWDVFPIAILEMEKEE